MRAQCCNHKYSLYHMHIHEQLWHVKSLSNDSFNYYKLCISPWVNCRAFAAMSVQIKVFVVGLITPGFLVYEFIYCIHLHIHIMCTVYKVPLWSLSLILVKGTFLVVVFFFLRSYIHNVYFCFLIKHSYNGYYWDLYQVEISSVTSTAVLYCSENSIVFLKGTPNW